jgi:DnaJ homolog subfamily B member 4
MVGRCLATNDHHDPYRILGVPREATQEEIRRRYRELCLQYHPDKNGHLDHKERHECESRFKGVQHANSQIGDAEARKEYDYRSQFATAPSFGDIRPESFFNNNSFMNGFTPRPNPFFFSYANANPSFAGGNPFVRSPFGAPAAATDMKSVFVQKVKVPLADLYAGRRHYEFVLDANPLRSCVAAFRGGLAYMLLYQSLLYALPMLRLSRLLSAIVGVSIFQFQVPSPFKRVYYATLLPGYKGGTKLTYRQVQRNMDVVFVLQEQRHELYYRQGNNLHYKAYMTPKEARQGHFIVVEPLDSSSMIPLELEMNHPKRPWRNGQEVVIENEGWPIRDGSGKKGNLIVHVCVRKGRKKQPLPKRGHYPPRRLSI